MVFFAGVSSQRQAAFVTISLTAGELLHTAEITGFKTN